MRRLALIAVFAVSVPARAQFIDQSNTSYNTPFYHGWFTAAFQTFIPSASTFNGVSVLVRDSGATPGSAQLGVYLFSGMPDLAYTYLVTSGAANRSWAAGETYWFDIPTGQVNITPGATHYLGLYFFTPTSSNIMADDANPYALGMAFTNYNAGNFGGPYDDFGGNYDLAFRTLTPDVVATPEPASVLLLGSGLLAGVVLRRRRRLAV